MKHLSPCAQYFETLFTASALKQMDWLPHLVKMLSSAGKSLFPQQTPLTTLTDYCFYFSLYQSLSSTSFCLKTVWTFSCANSTKMQHEIMRKATVQ